MRINTPNLALLKRSLMLDSRSVVTYVYRFCLLIGVLFCLMTFHNISQSIRFGADGLRFFQGIAYINLAFITLAGCTIFASAITEEKEDKTMALLLMTGIRPLTILLSKAGSRFFAGATLLVVQIPFTMFSITLGGISTEQIFAVYVALFAYLIFLCGLAIFMSTISRNSRKACILIVITLLIFHALHFIVGIILSFFSVKEETLVLHKLFQNIWEQITPINQINKICTTLLNVSPDMIFGVQFWTNILSGMTFLTLAWILFNHFNRAETDSENSPWFMFKRWHWLKIFAPTRVWTWFPLLWKEFYFSTGGFSLMIIKFTFYFLFYLLIVNILDFGNNLYAHYFIFRYLFLFALWALVLELTYFSSNLLGQEHKWRTWSSISILPHSTISLVYRRLIALVPTILPWGIYLLAVFFYDPSKFSHVFDEIFYGSSISLAIILYFLFYYHLTVYISLKIKFGAWAIAGVIALLLYFCTYSLSVEVLQCRTKSFIFFVIVFSISTTLYLHMQIIAKLEKIAASD